MFSSVPAVRTSRIVAAGLALLLLAAPALRAQAATPPGPAAGMGQEKMGMEGMKEPASGWKELDAFHEFLMATWHPAQRKKDLAPTRAKAADMAAAAKKWELATAPKACDTPKMHATVLKVSAGSRELAALVAKKANDAALLKQLAQVHQNFEAAEGGCKPKKA